MGVGIAAAILIDPTIIRAVLLPATMKLLGDWRWYLPTGSNGSRARPSSQPPRPDSRTDATLRRPTDTVTAASKTTPLDSRALNANPTQNQSRVHGRSHCRGL
jgi:hypothetical protein